jgi:hypothetical protein
MTSTSRFQSIRRTSSTSYFLGRRATTWQSALGSGRRRRAASG